MLAVPINIHFIGVPIHSSCNSSYCADSFFTATFVLCVFRGCVRVCEPLNSFGTTAEN